MCLVLDQFYEYTKGGYLSLEEERNELAFKVSILTVLTTERLEETKAELVARYEASTTPITDAEEESVARAVANEKEKEYQLAERCHDTILGTWWSGSCCWAPQASM